MPRDQGLSYAPDGTMDEVRKCRACGSTQYQIQHVYTGFRERLLIVQCGDCRDKIIPVLVDDFMSDKDVYGLCREKWNEANAVHKFVQLDYKALSEKAEARAMADASLMYPPGLQRDKKRKRLADEYYRQYITPPEREKL